MRTSTIAATAAVITARVVNAFIYPTRFDGTVWDDENWSITTTNLDQGHYQSRMSLANGYIGINVAAVGPFFEVDTPVNGDMINGWPLFGRRQTFATVAAFYDEQPTTNGSNFEWLNQYGGESVISGIPHFGGLHPEVGGEVLTATVPSDQISGFSSTLDIGAGVMTWTYTWAPANGPTIEIEYSMFIHKLYVNLAVVQLKMTATTDVTASVIDLLEGDCAVRTMFKGKGYEPVLPMIWTSVSPNGLDSITAYVYSTMVCDEYCNPTSRMNVGDPAIVGANSSSIAQAMDVSLLAGQTSTITKYVGVASSDAFSDPQNTALDSSRSGAQAGYTGLLASHIAEWQSIMTPDSVDSYAFPANGTLPDDANIIELQITAVTNPFYLLQNTVGINAVAAAGNNIKLDVNSISVGGLGSDSYAGFIFWDAEVWIAPGLVVAFPEAALQIANYRVKQFPQAQANVKTAYQSSQNMTGKFSDGAAVYSWTSSRYGNCTGTGPCFDYEYHINGDIGLELYNYYTVTGDSDFFRTQLFPVYDAVAQFYAELVTYNSTSGKYELYNATDPDEYANFQTNVGYTMVLMHTHIDNANMFRARFGMEQNQTWASISSLIDIPIDTAGDIILEYQTMNGSISVKQADVVLIDDFLDYPNPYSLSDLDYYAGKQSPNGPGMTYGVFSIVANQFSPSGCSSYTYDLYGSQPYTRGPWFQFSEQLLDDFALNGGTHPAYPFLTGIGGANRVAVFGFLGLKLEIDTLNINPSIPPQISNINYRTIYWQGWAINAMSNQTHTTLSRTGVSLPNANSTFVNAAIPVTIGVSGSSTTGSNSGVHELMPTGTLTFANRPAPTTKALAGNIAQCQPVTSPEDYEPGQFPLAAVDGATSTKWQPTQANISASLTVELPGPYVPITSMYFDWAQSPPDSYTVTFSNVSGYPYGPLTTYVTVSSSNSIAVSNPFSAQNQAAIVPYSSNSTNVTLSPAVYSGRYATLVINGNQANDGTVNVNNGTGATVAEWAIISSGGSNVA